mmetsp:Transcript_41081/g.109583  ORF Transcript_41081/g.109583 Transcript_41081/m.109583 type:complete len:230 (+) Transcript_41081:798-1487(+)
MDTIQQPAEQPAFSTERPCPLLSPPLSTSLHLSPPLSTSLHLSPPLFSSPPLPFPSSSRFNPSEPCHRALLFLCAHVARLSLRCFVIFGVSSRSSTCSSHTEGGLRSYRPNNSRCFSSKTSFSTARREKASSRSASRSNVRGASSLDRSRSPCNCLSCVTELVVRNPRAQCKPTCQSLALSCGPALDRRCRKCHGLRSTSRSTRAHAYARCRSRHSGRPGVVQARAEYR